MSAAMIYDNLPIIDSFRRASDDLVMGAMDSKLREKDGTYYFYMKRLNSSVSP